MLNLSHRVQQYQEREGMVPPTFRYHPDRDISHAPAPTDTPGTTNPVLRQQLEQSHNFMQTIMRDKEQRRRKVGKYAQPKLGAQQATPERPLNRAMSFAPNYVDQRFRSVRRQESECPICMAQFNAGDHVTRLTCDHILHCDCVDA